jgi:sulfite reductase (ferredoxin)
MNARPLPPEPKRTAVELQKEQSQQLRGTIAEELANADLNHLSDANKNLIKFHGSYQQEDRDARKARRREGVGKHYMFMVRCKIPGGKLTPEQYLAVDDLATRYANGTLRFTSRQGIQLHGVVKRDLHTTIRGINDCLLTTLGACGDVERNVMCCPAAFDPVRQELQRNAELIAKHFAPRSGAYHEIWINGQSVGSGQQAAGSEKNVLLPAAGCPLPIDEEPIYGKVYLPRKFKTGFGLTYDNCVDIYAQDLGLLALVERGQITGYNVLVGGGMGMSHGNANTFPFIGREIASIEPDQFLAAAEGVITLFRDHGNRADRKRARIKYLVHDWGVERFRAVLAEYVPFSLALPKPTEITGVDLHLGWHAQGNGKLFLGISVENGRVKDDGAMRMRMGLRTIVSRFRPNLSITPQQDLLLRDIDPKDRANIDALLTEHGILGEDKISLLQQYGMSCPAIPTCGLAISESERYLPLVVDELEKTIAEMGLSHEKISIRMTGCPNGCVRPYQSDIGIVGRSGEKYTVFVGGNVLGTRLNFVLQDLVHKDAITSLLTCVLRLYRADRHDGEGFGDFCHRLGQVEIQRRAEVPTPASGHCLTRLAAGEPPA